MDKRLIAANALSFFSMVIVYQAFLTVASPLSAIRLFRFLGCCSLLTRSIANRNGM